MHSTTGITQQRSRPCPPAHLPGAPQSAHGMPGLPGTASPRGGHRVLRGSVPDSAGFMAFSPPADVAPGRDSQAARREAWVRCPPSLVIIRSPSRAAGHPLCTLPSDTRQETAPVPSKNFFSKTKILKLYYVDSILFSESAVVTAFLR